MRASNDIVLYDPTVGEIIRLNAAQAPDEQLADVYESTIPRLEAQLKAAKEIVSDELVGRLDRNGRWTLRVGDHRDVQWVINAPSPDVGTSFVDAHVLDEVLGELMEEGVISQQAASAALERTVTVTFRVDTQAEVDDIVDRAHQDERVKDVEAALKVRAAGVRALEKIPAARERVQSARFPCDPPKRRVRVRRVERAA